MKYYQGEALDQQIDEFHKGATKLQRSEQPLCWSKPLADIAVVVAKGYLTRKRVQHLRADLVKQSASQLAFFDELETSIAAVSLVRR